MEKEKDIFDHIKPRKIEVPDTAYFKQLTEKVVEENRVKVVPFYRKPIAWVGAAAAVVAIVLLSNLFTNDPVVDSNPLLALNECSKAEISAYIEDNLHAFDSDLLEEYVPEDSLEIDLILIEEASSTQHEEPTISLDEIDKQDILDYFDEYEIDPYELDDEDIFI